MQKRKVKNLTLDEAIKFLQNSLEEMRKEPRGELKDIDADTAFEKGYEICLNELIMLTRKESK